MHPDGVFVFLSLLIYGGLSYTQKKNLHFNFHSLFLSLQHSSSARELEFCFPQLPHIALASGGYRSRDATGSALWEQSSCCRDLWWDRPLFMPSKDPWHVWSCFSALSPLCDKGVRQHPLLLPCLLTCSERQQPANQEGCLGMLTPLPSPLSQGWQEEKQKPWGLVLSLIPAGSCLF